MYCVQLKNCLYTQTFETLYCFKVIIPTKPYRPRPIGHTYSLFIQYSSIVCKKFIYFIVYLFKKSLCIIFVSIKVVDIIYRYVYRHYYFVLKQVIQAFSEMFSHAARCNLKRNPSEESRTQLKCQLMCIEKQKFLKGVQSS